MTPTQASSYKNIMEIIVDEEIDRQTQHFPAETAQRLNRIELATYALNRLPPLYASSREGVDFQYERGKSELNSRVVSVVEKALSVIKEAPERESTPFL